MAYCLFSLVYFRIKTKKTLTKYGKLSTNHAMLKRWIYLLCSIQFIISANTILNTLHVVGIYFDFESKTYIKLFTSQFLYFTVAGSGFFLQNLFLFLFPKILYGNVSFVPQNGNILQDFKSNIPKKRKKTEIDLEIEKELDIYIQSLPFIKQEFSLAQMAFDLKISERTLSHYFNTELNSSFSQWRKKIRIDHAIHLINAGESKKITLAAIATHAGFASRSKFIDAFKEQKGTTPSAYIKSIENK